MANLDPRPLEDFSMWTMLRRGGQKRLDDVYAFDGTRYCPRCGAKMEEALNGQ